MSLEDDFLTQANLILDESSSNTENSNDSGIEEFDFQTIMSSVNMRQDTGRQSASSKSLFHKNKKILYTGEDQCDELPSLDSTEPSLGGSLRRGRLRMVDHSRVDTEHNSKEFFYPI